MTKESQIKKKIEQTLLNPPPPEQMLKELRLNNIVLRQRSGNIEMFLAINNNLIEQVWKAMKARELIEKNYKELRKLGVNHRAIMQNISALDERISDNINNPHQNPIDGFIKDGFLELEVFRSRKQDKN